MDSIEHLSIDNREGLLWITLDRTDKANALTAEMMVGAATALHDAAADDAVRAILLTGAGEKVFSGGVDVRQQPSDGDVAAHRERRSAALAAFMSGVLDT